MRERRRARARIFTAPAHRHGHRGPFRVTFVALLSQLSVSEVPQRDRAQCGTSSRRIALPYDVRERVQGRGRGRGEERRGEGLSSHSARQTSSRGPSSVTRAFRLIWRVAADADNLDNNARDSDDERRGETTVVVAYPRAAVSETEKRGRGREGAGWPSL